MRRTHMCGFLAKRHSQMVTTRQPSRRNAAALRRSRCWFLIILARQSAAFVRGTRFRPQSCPCQKHPCRKTATRSDCQLKSGRRPTTDACRLQPCTPDSRKRATKRSSVVALPLLRTRAIKAERDRPPKVVRCSLGFPACTTVATDRLRCVRHHLFREERRHRVADHFTHEVDAVGREPK